MTSTRRPSVWTLVRAALLLAGILLAAPMSLADAQRIIGTIRDSTTEQPIPGAVLILTSPTGTTVARTISGSDGRYTFAARGDGSHLRALHIGFRPRDVELPALATAITAVDITLSSLGNMLDTIHVVANNRCASQRDGRADGLLDQAREAVLATDVAAESKPAYMVRLAYVRQFDRDGKASSQTVRVVADSSVDSFRAVFSAEQFVQYGFQQDSAGYLVFFAPDARTVVDPAFGAGYCFRLTSDRSRPLEVGLTFEPSAPRSNRVDIQGTLWADTAKRELRDIEFDYTQLDPAMHRVRPGGRIAFATLPNGIVLVNDWTLRLPVVRRDSMRASHGTMAPLNTYAPQETGGRVVSARWPDYTWNAAMGALEASLRDSTGAPLPRAFARLDGTDYTGRADATGILHIPRLLPGPYTLTVVDSAFADLPVKIPEAARFEARVDTVTRLVATVARPFDGVAEAFCADGVKPGTTSVVIGRFYESDSSTDVPQGVVTAGWLPAGSVEPTDSLQVQTTANAGGLFALCGLPAGTRIALSGSRGADRTAAVTTTTPERRTLMRANVYLLKP